MVTSNNSTVGIVTVENAIKTIKRWDKDAKSRRYEDKKDAAIKKIHDELPIVAKIWPVLKQTEILQDMLSDIGDKSPAPLLYVVQTVFDNRPDKKKAIEKCVGNLAQDIVAGSGGFLHYFQSLADDLRYRKADIKSKIADSPHTKPSTQQETPRQIIVNVEEVFSRNGIWRKAFVRLVNDEQREGVDVSEGSFNKIKSLLTEKGRYDVADKLKHKNGKMTIDIPPGQIAVFP